MSATIAKNCLENGASNWCAKCREGGKRRREDMCYERRLSEACVD
jgi:hypothetical protein